MAVKIGHSSIDENGKARGGAAGDSTGKELCTRGWYKGGWNVLLRPKTAALAEKSAKACEAGCANNKIGYDQNQRNTLNTQAKAVGYDLSKIATGCECDCSSFMHVCAIAGGAKLSYGSNGYTTRSMVANFVKSGDYEKLTDSKYLTSDKYLKRGDILVKEGSHTVMVLEDGANAAAGSSASADKVQTNSTGTTTPKAATECAKSLMHSESLKGTYKVTASSLNVRYGAGTDKKKIIAIKNGTQVKCYGYYAMVSDVMWYFVHFVYNGENYVGFASSRYLKK